MTPRILIIAGSDSGGGAGIQADIKTVTMLGGFATTAITAITAQNTLGVQTVHPVPTEMVVAQIDSVLSDIGTDAIKIGMIGSAETANAVADRLVHVEMPIVFDPVMVATSGAVLADDATISAFRRLMALASVTTPNLPEFDALGGPGALVGPTLVKGGHGTGDTIVDRLVDAGAEVARWENGRIDTTNTHGTGCTLASAIAVGLAEGMDLPGAVKRARTFVRLALREAPGFGAGHGPMGHHAVRLDCGPEMRLSQISIPGLAASASARQFYETLGLRCIVESLSGDYEYLRFEAPGGVTLSSYPGGEGIYFECDDLDATVERLRAAGIGFDRPPTDQAWGWRQAWTRDPADNAVCLFQAGENRRFPPWRLP